MAEDPAVWSCSTSLTSWARSWSVAVPGSQSRQAAWAPSWLCRSLLFGQTRPQARSRSTSFARQWVTSKCLREPKARMGISRRDRRNRSATPTVSRQAQKAMGRKDLGNGEPSDLWPASGVPAATTMPAMRMDIVWGHVMLDCTMARGNGVPYPLPWALRRTRSSRLLVKATASFAAPPLAPMEGATFSTMTGESFKDSFSSSRFAEVTVARLSNLRISSSTACSRTAVGVDPGAAWPRASPRA
mmetsp:Transcript_4461/g.13342  ORF Transcript_4461/g.13342 Transcript_4461/m.13342 type:complete len:244 (-) Transcript_4461:1419-2150(-)